MLQRVMWLLMHKSCSATSFATVFGNIRYLQKLSIAHYSSTIPPRLTGQHRPISTTESRFYVIRIWPGYETDEHFREFLKMDDEIICMEPNKAASKYIWLRSEIGVMRALAFDSRFECNGIPIEIRSVGYTKLENSQLTRYDITSEARSPDTVRLVPLPFSITEADIVKFFRPIKIDRIIVTKMAPILSYLHVKFTSVEDAQRALKLHRQPIGNKQLPVCVESSMIEKSKTSSPIKTPVGTSRK